MNRFSRSEMLFGADALAKLRKSKVIVFGIGGVGSFVCEALARGGIGTIALVDNDCIDETNINRQLIAMTSTIGHAKVDVMAERIMDINPYCTVFTHHCFYTDKKDVDIAGFDYVIDAIDTVSSKLALIEEADALKIPIISCMGTGNKIDPTQFEIADISKTSVCPLARVMRRELKARGIYNLNVLYSRETPKKPKESEQSGMRHVPASASFVPPVAGMIIAGRVICDLK